MHTLKITYNAGFFSCCSKRLEAIVWFFNTHKQLPDRVDSTEQFSFYTNATVADPASLYFKEKEDIAIPYVRPVRFYNNLQFLPYKELDFAQLKPFIEKYFTPSDAVLAAVGQYEEKYHIDYDRTCAVFYRGNDKVTEAKVPTHELFLSKARVIKKEHPELTFLVQTDETAFLEAFLKEFPDSITFEEMTSVNNKQSMVALELPQEDRIYHGIQFLSAVIVLSRCNTVITHSGNGSLWCMLFRGNTDQVYQAFPSTWDKMSLLYELWYRSKRHIKKLIKPHADLRGTSIVIE